MRSLQDYFRSSLGNWRCQRFQAWKILIVANITLTTLQTVCEWTIGRGWLEQFLALHRDTFLQGQVWQALTYMFIHGSPGDLLGRVLHLLFNVLGIFWFGREVETATGWKNLLGIYFVGGLFGAAAHLAFGPGSVGLAGASAGVLALFLAFTTILPNIELSVFLFFFFPVRMKARQLAIAFVLFTVVCLASGIYRQVAHLPHLAGCLAGWLYARGLGYGRPLRAWPNRADRKRREARWEKMPTNEFISSEIDPILDKISRQGIHSLTRQERKILEKGRERIAQKVTPKRAE